MSEVAHPSSRQALTDTPDATVTLERWIIPEQAEALAGLLDIAPPPRADGDALPPLWHWIYMTARPPQSALGVDGHPTHGIPEPPGPGYARMFAGGRVRSLEPLRFGKVASQSTRVKAVAKKNGKSGPLTFVTTMSEVTQDGRVKIIEEQDVVYREFDTRVTSRTPGTGRPDSNSADGDVMTFDVDPVVLFRFSALTYNAHRIHYDRPYALTEGHPDLVVHGPLQALLIGEAFRRRDHDALTGAQFSYRLLAPTFGPQRLRVRSHTDAPHRMTVYDAAGVATARGATAPYDDAAATSGV